MSADGDPGWNLFFANLDDAQVGRVWARSMREMRDRGLIRSWNNPVADYAERMVADHLGLELAPPVAQGYDAVGADGIRYQIKSRRLTPQNKSRQLGAIRKLELKEFDDLIAVIFNVDLEVQEMWQIPHAVIVEFAKWVPTLNGHRVWVRPPMTDHPSVTRLL